MILIGNRPVLWEECYRKGLIYVHQLFEDNSVINARTAMTSFGLTQMKLNQLISAVPKPWMEECKRGIKKECSGRYADLMKKKNITGSVYTELINCGDLKAKCIQWEREFESNNTRKATANTFLQTVLHYKHPKNEILPIQTLAQSSGIKSATIPLEHERQ